MPDPIKEFRPKILEAVTKRIRDLFGPDAPRNLFRKVRRGAWRPGGISRPSCTVVDDGSSVVRQIRDMDQAPSDGSHDIELKVMLVLELEENWDREETFNDWTNNVSEIIRSIANWRPTGCGVLEVKYRDDDPFTVEYSDGASRELWIINFNILYFEETPATA